MNWFNRNTSTNILTEARLSSSTDLQGFAKNYTIKGIKGYDPQSFLDGVRENITRILRNNRSTKVKLILKSNIYITRHNGIASTDFHSYYEINLDETDENDLYDRMTERILEKMETYLDKNSIVRFHSVIKLELHTIEYIDL